MQLGVEAEEYELQRGRRARRASSAPHAATAAPPLQSTGVLGSLKVLLVWLLFLLPGCYRARLAPPEMPHATQPKSETVWPMFWGLAQPEIAAGNCMGNGVSEVTVSTNFGFVMLTLVTLGITSPVNVEWRCAKDQGPSGENEGDEL